MIFVLRNGIKISSRAFMALVAAHKGRVTCCGRRLFRNGHPIPAAIADEMRPFLTPECKLNKLGRQVLACPLAYTYLQTNEAAKAVAA